MSKPVRAEQQNASRRWHMAALVFGHEVEGVQVLLPQPPDPCKELGSRSEVDRFRVEAWHRAFVERLPTREALHLGDERIIGPPVRRAHPHVRPRLRASPGDMVWTRRAGMDLDCDHVGLAPGKDLEIRQQTRGDGVGDQAGDPLFQGERVRNPAHVPSAVLYPNENNAAGSIGKGDNRAQQSLRRRQVALELEGLALGAAQCVEEVHTRKYARKLRPAPAFRVCRLAARDRVRSHDGRLTRSRPHACGSTHGLRSRFRSPS